MNSLFRSLSVSILICAVAIPSSAQSAEEVQVREKVEQFLVRLGSGDLEQIPILFAEHANIRSTSFRNGEWVGKSETFETWFSGILALETPPKFDEPVSNWNIHIESGQLAFVRADATLIVEGKPVSHNIDYFTLVLDDGEWRFINASYVATPIK